MDHLGRLLRAASGFYAPAAGESPLGHPQLTEKRALFVKCTVQLMCKCTKVKDVALPPLKVGLSNRLTQIETVVNSGAYVVSCRVSACVTSCDVYHDAGKPLVSVVWLCMLCEKRTCTIAFICLRV